MSIRIPWLFATLALGASGCKPPAQESQLQQDIYDEVLSIEEIDQVPVHGMLYYVAENYASYLSDYVAGGGRIAMCTATVPMAQEQMILDTLKGVFVDGLGGDACTLYEGVKWCAFEAARLRVTLLPFGDKLLDRWGVDSSYERFDEFKERGYALTEAAQDYLRHHGKDTAITLYRLKTDPNFAIKTALNVHLLLSAALAEAMEVVSTSPCAAIREKMARMIGMLGYEVSLDFAVSVGTAGAATAFVLGKLILRLARIARQSTGTRQRLVLAVRDGLRKIARTMLQKSKYARKLDAVDRGDLPGGRPPARSFPCGGGFSLDGVDCSAADLLARNLQFDQQMDQLTEISQRVEQMVLDRVLERHSTPVKQSLLSELIHRSDQASELQRLERQRQDLIDALSQGVKEQWQISKQRWEELHRGIDSLSPVPLSRSHSIIDLNRAFKRAREIGEYYRSGKRQFQAYAESIDLRNRLRALTDPERPIGSAKEVVDRLAHQADEMGARNTINRFREALQTKLDQMRTGMPRMRENVRREVDQLLARQRDGDEWGRLQQDSLDEGREILARLETELAKPKPVDRQEAQGLFERLLDQSVGSTEPSLWHLD